MPDRVVGVFGSVDFGLVHAFKEAVKTDRQADAEEIRALAKRLDALRSRFEGLPRVAARNLDEALNYGAIKGRVEKELEAIDAELVKESPETSVLTISLQAVAVDWPQILEGEAEAPDGRVQTSHDEGHFIALMGQRLAAVEEWAQQAVAASELPSQWNGLLIFAGEYDRTRKRLVPPQPTPESALQPRVGHQVATKHLTVAEADLEYPKIPDPKRLLDSLRGAIGAMPEGGVDEISERLSSALRSTEDRVLKGYQEALASGQRRRCNAIKDFAEQFDQVGQSSGHLKGGPGATRQSDIPDERAL